MGGVHGEVSVVVPWETARDRRVASSGGGSHLRNTSKEKKALKTDIQKILPYFCPMAKSKWIWTARGS